MFPVSFKSGRASPSKEAFPLGQTRDHTKALSSRGSSKRRKRRQANVVDWDYIEGREINKLARLIAVKSPETRSQT
jgi:hypothetical protein